MKMGVWMLVGGLLVATGARAGDSRDIEKLLAVKAPQAEPAPAYLPECTAPALRGAEEKKPDSTIRDSWYLRLLNGIAMGSAILNTQKQNDGRPTPPGSSR